MHTCRIIAILCLAASLAACAPSISTKRAEMPPAQSGRLDMVVRSAGTVPPDDVTKAKIRLKRSFRDAGYDPVELADSRQGSPRTIEINLTKYDQSTPSKNAAVASGVACVYVCPLFAPCLLLPIYYEPQFEIAADVALYDHDQRSFSASLAERAVSASNLIETGNDQFRDELEELAVHNFIAQLMGMMAEQGTLPRVQLQRPGF